MSRPVHAASGPRRLTTGPPRRRGRVRYVILGLFLAAFFLTAATVVGVAPGLSSLAGTAHSRDLGVRFTEADLLSAQRKLASNGGTLDVTLSQEELSAYLTHVVAGSDFRVSDLQLRLEVGNRFEAAGMATYEGRDYPVYLRGNAEIHAGSTQSRLDKARIAGLPLPEKQRREIEEAIEAELGGWLASESGVRPSLLQTENGSIRLVGGAPE